MVLLVLVMLWVAVLAPGFIRKRRERLSSTSIDSFHHELHLLERSGPKLVSPAYRLETAAAGEAALGAVPNAGLPTITSRPGRPKLVLVGQGNAELAPQAGTASAEQAGWARGAGPARRPSDYQRRQVLKRRRDIFTGLVATFLLTAVLGMVHSLRMLWVITVLAGLALVAFVALMAYARRMMLERRELQVNRAVRARPAMQPDGDPVVLASYRSGARPQPAYASYAESGPAVASR